VGVQFGVRGVSVTRIGPPSSTNIIDTRAFLKFVYKNAANLGIDSGRIALSGFSNTAHAVQIVAQENRKAKGIQAVVAIEGLSKEWQHLKEPGLPSYLFVLGDAEEHRSKWAPRQFKGARPDLDKHNVDYEVLLMPGAGHRVPEDVRPMVTKKAKEFLAKHLSG